MPDQPTGSSGLTSVADPVADLVERVDAERHRHPPLGAEQVDRQRHLAPGRALEQQRRAAGPDRPGDDLADLQVGSTGTLDPAQLARAAPARRGSPCRSAYGKPRAAMAASLPHRRPHAPRPGAVTPRCARCPGRMAAAVDDPLAFQEVAVSSRRGMATTS